MKKFVLISLVSIALTGVARIKSLKSILQGIGDVIGNFLKEWIAVAKKVMGML